MLWGVCSGWGLGRVLGVDGRLELRDPLPSKYLRNGRHPMMFHLSQCPEQAALVVAVVAFALVGLGWDWFGLVRFGLDWSGVALFGLVCFGLFWTGC